MRYHMHVLHRLKPDQKPLGRLHFWASPHLCSNHVATGIPQLILLLILMLCLTISAAHHFLFAV